MMEEFNHFKKIADALHGAAVQVVKKTAFDIQASAASKAPVDTGFLRNSIYTVTSDSSSYTGGANALPEIPHAENGVTAYVAVGANYGLFVEMGTTRMPARPYFYPAVEAARAPFDQAMSVIKDKLSEAAS